MTEVIKQSELQLSHRRRRAIRRAEEPRNGGGPPAFAAPELPTQDELERLHSSLSAVTPENHPRTARLLGSSTRKTAQKVIEEAGEVALEAVKHHNEGIIRESADLLYHLVALWHRAGIDPAAVWTEMRWRAETFGIAEKRPKTSKTEQARPDRTDT